MLTKLFLRIGSPCNNDFKKALIIVLKTNPVNLAEKSTIEFFDESVKQFAIPLCQNELLR